MADNNPISFKDLFNFNDKSTIEAGVNGIRALRKEYQAFFKSIMNGQMARLKQQEAALMAQNVQLANSVKGLSIANKQHQATLLAALQAQQRATASAAALSSAQSNVTSAMNATNSTVKSLSSEWRRLKREYEAAMQAGDKASMKRIAAEARALDKQIKQVNDSLRHTTRAFNGAKGSYDALSNANAKLIAKLQAMPGAINANSNATQRLINRLTGMNAGMNNTSAAAQRLRAQIAANNRLLNNFNTGLNRSFNGIGMMGRGLNNLKSQFVGFIAGYASLQGVLMAGQAAFSTALKLDSAEAAIKFSFGDVEGEEKMEMLRETSERLGLELTSLSTSYKMFAGAAKAANFDMVLADRIFQQVANAGARLRLSADDVSGALRAIQQMISKGNVQAEELRGQLGERLPGAFSIAARAMGVTEEKLNQLLKAGDVTAKYMLPLLADELERTFDSDTAVDNLQSSVNRLINTFTNAVDNGNLGQFFKEIIDGARDAIGWIEKWGEKFKNIKMNNIRANKDSYFMAPLPEELKDLEKYEAKIGSDAISDAKKRGKDRAAEIIKDSQSNVNALIKASNAEKKAYQKISKELAEAKKGTAKFNEQVFITTEGKKEFRGTADAFKKYKDNIRRVEKLRLEQEAVVWALEESRKNLMAKTDKNASFFDISTFDGLEAEIKRLLEIYDKMDAGTAAAKALKVKIEKYQLALKHMTPGWKPPKGRKDKDKEADGPFEKLQKQKKDLEDDFQDDLTLGATVNPIEAELYLAVMKKIKDVQEQMNELEKDGITKKIERIDLEIAAYNSKFEAGLIGEQEFNEEVAKLELDRITQERSRFKVGTVEYEEFERKRHAIKKGYTEKTINLIIKQAQAERDALSADYDKNFKGVVLKDKDKPTKEEASQLAQQREDRIKHEKQIFEITAREVEARLKLYAAGTPEYKAILAEQGALFKSNEEKKTADAQEEADKQLANVRDALSQMTELTGPLGSVLEGSFQQLFGSLSSIIESLVQDTKVGVEQILEVMLAANSLLSETFAAGSERRIEALEKEKDRELEAAGTNADAKKKIEANYQKKIAAERTKQARAEKVFALFQIALNTAIAVTKVTAQTGIGAPFLIPAIIALGALQAIAVAAQPIPKYAKGRQGGPAEIAMVGEQGTEAIEEDGKFRLSGKKAHLTYLKKGAKVHTATATKKLMDNWSDGDFANKVLASFVDGTSVMAQQQAAINESLVKAIAEGNQFDEQAMGKLFEKAISGIPVHEHHVDQFGEYYIRREKGLRLKDLNALTTTWKK